MIDKNVRIDEIAQLAHVSASTVSRVINHPKQVSQKTSQAVFSAMKELGIDGTALTNVKDINKTSKIIMFNIPDIENPFFSEVLHGINACALSRNYTPLLYIGIITQDNLQDFKKLLTTVNAKGLISMTQIDDDVLRELDSILPFVQCSEMSSSCAVTKVGIDNKQAAKDATNYLIAKGCRDIAFLGSNPNNAFSYSRQKGYQEAIDEAGIIIPKGWIVNLPHIDYESAYSAAAQLLNNDHKPRAIFAVSDILAVAAINAAHQNKLKVPEELSVIGFDNVFLSLLSNPTITTVSQPRYQLGFIACEMLFQRIANPDQPVMSSIQKTELIIRESA